MKIGGIVFSFILHAFVVIGALSMPRAPILKTDHQIMLISLTEGSIGGSALPSPVLGHLPTESTKLPPHRIKPDIAKSSPKPNEQPIVKKTPSVVKSTDTVTEPQKKVLKKTPPQDHPKATPIAQVPTTTPEHPKKSTIKPKAPAQKQTTPKPQTIKNKEKVAQNKKATEKTAESPDDILKAALANAEANAEADSLRSALSAAELDVSQTTDIGGGGGEGDGEGGGGLYDIYAGQVILAVRPNWSMPTYTREKLVAHVRVRLAPDGTVLEARLEKGSIRPDFNASTVNAVLRTRVLPPPPTTAQQDIIIVFNSLELMNTQ